MIGPDGIFVSVAGLHEPGGIIAVHADGAPFWRARAEQTPSLPPALGPDGAGGWTVYLADRNGKLTAFNELNGQERWDVEVGGAISAMAVLDDLVLIGAADGVLYAVETADGGVRWRVEVGTVTTPPLSVAGKIWLGLAEGALVALEE
jgi:outer membrane protein assembly factor BamB